MYDIVNGVKTCRSLDYNYRYRITDGFFARWGKRFQDDPDFSPYGPEIADIEVSTKCKGAGGKLCSFCYKANTPDGKNMSLETFKQVFKQLPKNLTQIAFGADANCTSNPDIFKMMAHCRDNDIVPNITVADIDDNVAEQLSKYCGAVAVSRYDNKEICYESIRRLDERDFPQINIHIMISEETYDMALETLRDYRTDDRLKTLSAIVFLSLKPRGRGHSFTPLSSLFSVYVNVDGDFYPCSFAEGCGDWKTGISVADSTDFMDQIWYSQRVEEFRTTLLANLDENGVRECPLFDV